MSTELLSYSQFELYVQNYFQNKYGLGVKIRIYDVPRNNGIILRGLTIIPDGIKISPTIYLESFYQEYVGGVPMSRITDEIEDVYREGSQMDASVIDYFYDYSQVKDTLVIKLVNYKRNAVFLENVPHKKVLDFAICVQSRMDFQDLEGASITIRQEHLDMWDVGEEFFKDAVLNSMKMEPESFLSMRKLLKELQPLREICPDEEARELFVLTNTGRINGAAVMFYPGVLEQCAKELEGDFFLLPSSIHEVLLLKDEDVSVPDLLRMVREVNDSHVAREDILSYAVYRYDRKMRILENYVTGEKIELDESDRQAGAL